MKKNRFQFASCAFLLLCLAWVPPFKNRSFNGLQPQLSQDVQGTIRLVFGRADSIFCATSADAGNRFSEAVFVGRIAGMHLGATRGPQLASSAHYSVITAIDKTGTIHFFRLRHATGVWKYGGIVNDTAASAPEGLMSLAADTQDRFYAVWLDVRRHQTNNICFSMLSGNEPAWKKNKLIYISPDGHVCECCKPGIAVKNATVAVMFRNWRSGSRDLYLTTSPDRGRTFGDAQKLGNGTWPLKGCPMDGGGVAIDGANNVHTVWQREGTVYYCKPGAAEEKLTTGRTCSIALGSAGNEAVATLQQGDAVKLIDVVHKKEMVVGNGSFLTALSLGDGKMLCAWEENKTIRLQKL